MHRIAVVADIEKAFLIIAVSQRDRDALRFLWVRDLKKHPPEVCVYRFARVVFGVACSPFLLNATLHQHINKYQSTHPDLVNQLNRSIYVDDVVLGASTVELAQEVCSESRGILLEGGFNLRKFLTNHEELQVRISESPEGKPDETYTSTMLGKSQTPLTGERKVLGVRRHRRVSPQHRRDCVHGMEDYPIETASSQCSRSLLRPPWNSVPSVDAI